MRAEAWKTVVLSDRETAPPLADRLSPSGGPAAWYPSVEELMSDRSLASVGVLVLHCRPLPKGVVLAHLGRMNLEFPGLQVVALLERVPPLPVAEYLTACGVELVWNGAKGGSLDRLAAAVGRMHERSPWITSQRVTGDARGGVT